MRNSMRKILIRAALLAACGLFAAGCFSPAPVYRDVMESRQDAYNKWLQGRQSDKKLEVRADGNLSLADALTLSLVNNKNLQAAIEDKGVAKGRMVEAVGEALPSVELNSSYTRDDKVLYTTIEGERVPLNVLNTYSNSLVVTQPLYRGGAISAGVRAARVYTALTNEGIRSVTQQVIFTVAAAYYDVLLSQELLKVQQDGVKASEKSLQVVLDKKARGAATKFDVLRAQVELSNFQAQEIQERNSVNRGITRLLLAMGISQDSKVVLSDKLVYRPMKPVYEEAVRVAYMNRPDIYQAELQIRLQREAVRVAYSTYLPSADVNFTEVYARPGPNELTVGTPGWGWTAGASMNWTLFNGFQREGTIMVQKATLRKNNIELLETEEFALQQISAAVLSVNDADEFVQSQKLNLDRATEGLRLAQVGLKGGVNTEVEVYDAQAALTQALAFYYEALHDHMLARLALELAMGVLGPKPAEQVKPGQVKTPGEIEEFMQPEKPAPQPKPEAGGTKSPAGAAANPGAEPKPATEPKNPERTQP